ncbi:MAG: MFS transporter [Verrucomicrobiota bacterium]
MEGERKPGAAAALTLLIGINLFNYIDRQVLSAVEPEIRATFFRANDPNAMALTGALGTAFFVTYMLAAPIMGWLADRFHRWIIIGIAVGLWSLASGASGLATSFGMLLATRICVGIGEGGWGPAGPTLLSDLFPIRVRGRVMAAFAAAIPVGSALAYVIGGLVKVHLGWRWTFFLITPPGLVLALLCFFQRDPRFGISTQRASVVARRSDYRQLLSTRSYVINTLAQTAFTFALGGMAFWMPAYLEYRGLPKTTMTMFGGIIVIAGLISTLFGGSLADRMRDRFPSSYFLVSGVGMLLAFPFFVATLYTPFPAAWFFLFVAVFFAFLNIGPSNTALANVAMPLVRATAFALNIFVIHILGDAIAFPIIGFVGGHWNMTIAFLLVSGMMLLAGLIWLFGMRGLAADTNAVEQASARVR